MTYDSIIIGGGPAGLSAAIYASRSKLKCIVLEAKSSVGGQIATTSEIENWPGKITTGPELMQDFENHCKKFNIPIHQEKIVQIKTNSAPNEHSVITESGKTYSGKTIIIATGAEPRVLGIPGELEFRGKGVCYCATCDGEFFEELEIVTVGSGNTSLEESLFLTRFASKVTVIVLHDEGIVDGDKVALEALKKNDKVNFIWNSTVSEIYGDKLVSGVKIKNVKTNEITDFPTDGVFMFVGISPNTSFAEKFIDTVDAGYIKTQDTLTNIPGIFAAGDVIDKALRQVVTAASDGALAAVKASQYIEKLN